MAIGFWPLILMHVKEIQMDRRFAEKDINLKLYGRTVYIVTQVISRLTQQLTANDTLNNRFFIAVHSELRSEFVHLVGVFVTSS